MNLKLVSPSVSNKESFLKGLLEIKDQKEQDSWIYLGDSIESGFLERDFNDYVSALLSRETSVPTGLVTDTIYWAKVGDEIVGRISLRHELNDFLRHAGGHIGYIVRPSWRGKGVASAMLEQILQTPRAKQIQRLLLTCDAGNVASEKTILKNGGVLENIVKIAHELPLKKRFWITLNH